MNGRYHNQLCFFERHCHIIHTPHCSFEKSLHFLEPIHFYPYLKRSHYLFPRARISLNRFSMILNSIKSLILWAYRPPLEGRHLKLKSILGEQKRYLVKDGGRREEPIVSRIPATGMPPMRSSTVRSNFFFLRPSYEGQLFRRSPVLSRELLRREVFFSYRDCTEPPDL